MKLGLAAASLLAGISVFSGIITAEEQTARTGVDKHILIFKPQIQKVEDISPNQVRSVAAIIAALKTAYRTLNDLQLNDDISFETQGASGRYDRALSKLSSALRALKDWQDENGDETEPENFRGRATVYIRQHVSNGWQSDVIRALPSFVGEGDIVAIKTIVDNINSGFIANFIRAYFTKTLTRPKRNNRKGVAGAYIVENVSRGWVEASLRILPGFLSEDDHQAVRSIVDETSSGFVPDALKDYFQ